MSVGDVVFSSSATITLLTALAASVVAALTAFVVVRALTNRPARRTTARARLERRNPTLCDRTDLRWTVRARRVRTDRLTAFVVAAALVLASTLSTVRPTTIQPSDDR